MIYFPYGKALCVFPDKRSNLTQAVSALKLEGGYPVIAFIAFEIEKRQADVTRKAIDTITGIAEDIHAVVICRGTNKGVMAEIGRIKSRNHNKFQCAIGVCKCPAGVY